MTIRWSGPVTLSLVAVGAVVVAMALHPRLGLRPARHSRGIPDCAPRVVFDLLAPEALECWLHALHGRWRIRSHVSAHGALVVEIAAEDVRDADAIAHRMIETARPRFSEVLVYVRPDRPAGGVVPVVRTRWTVRHGLERMEYVIRGVRS